MTGSIDGSTGPSLSGEASPPSDLAADLRDLFDFASSFPDFSSSYFFESVLLFCDLLLLLDFFDLDDFDVSYLLKFFSKMLKTRIICPKRPPIAPTACVESSCPSISEIS